MRRYYLVIALALLLPACSQNSATTHADNNSENKMRKQVTAVAEKYIINQLTEPEKTVMENGIIMMRDKQKGYVIEPSKIYLGLIDDDKYTDAIVSLATFQGQYQTVSEQLIILRTGRNFTLVSALESDMIIISLKERIITADVPEHKRDNPLFNCPSCREVIKYRFRMGELVKVE